VRRTVAILGLVSGIAAAPAVRAGDELVSPTPPPEKSRTPPDSDDFGWQVLVADLAGMGATIALANSTNSAASLFPYLFGAPIVHAAHGDVPGALGSLLLNAALPAGFAYAGYRLDAGRCGPDEDGCGGVGALLGLLVGFGLATGLDAGVLAHPDRWTTPAPPVPRFGVSPSFAFNPDGRFSLGLTGRF
jgi:hypothetical protein